MLVIFTDTFVPTRFDVSFSDGLGGLGDLFEPAYQTNLSDGCDPAVAVTEHPSILRVVPAFGLPNTFAVVGNDSVGNGLGAD